MQHAARTSVARGNKTNLDFVRASDICNECGKTYSHDTREFVVECSHSATHAVGTLQGYVEHIVADPRFWAVVPENSLRRTVKMHVLYRALFDMVWGYQPRTYCGHGLLTSIQFNSTPDKYLYLPHLPSNKPIASRVSPVCKTRVPEQARI